MHKPARTGINRFVIDCGVDSRGLPNYNPFCDVTGMFFFQLSKYLKNLCILVTINSGQRNWKLYNISYFNPSILWFILRLPIFVKVPIWWRIISERSTRIVSSRCPPDFTGDHHQQWFTKEKAWKMPTFKYPD